MNRVPKYLLGGLLFIGGAYMVADHFAAGPRITFHGRVIDADEKGIPGATIEYEIQQGSIPSFVFPFAFNPRSRGSVESDDDGNFRIKGRGYTLTVRELREQGFRSAQRNSVTFGYHGNPEPYRSSPDNPALFLMKRDGDIGARQVLDKTLSFRWNQGAVEIPVPEVGTLVILPERNHDAVNKIRDFDWQVSVSLRNGTLAPMSEGEPPIAPLGGYLPEIHTGGKSGDSSWWGTLRTNYFFRTAEGKYGRIHLNIYADRPDLGANGFISAVYNESGSRDVDK